MSERPAYWSGPQRLREARERARSALVNPPPPRPPLAPTGRAGRNLPAAFGVAFVLLAVVAASLFVRKEAFVVVAVVAVTVAVWELAVAVAQREIRIPLVPLWVGSVGIVLAAYAAGLEAMLVAYVLTAGGVFVWRVLDSGGPQAVRDASAGIFAAAYVPLLAGFVMLLLAADDGPVLVATFILLVIANDTGGYAAGVLFGRTPMARTISPKKSWEGAAGSLVLATVAGAVLAGVALGGVPWWAGLLLGAATVVTATLGDLAESLLKRDLGLKDMGSILPGHGGVMDRLDSILVTAPVFYLLVSLLS